MILIILRWRRLSRKIYVPIDNGKSIIRGITSEPRAIYGGLNRLANCQELKKQFKEMNPKIQCVFQKLVAAKCKWLG